MNRDISSGYESISLHIQLFLKSTGEVLLILAIVHTSLALSGFYLLWPLKALLLLKALYANLQALAGFREHGVVIPPSYWSRLHLCYLCSTPVWLSLWPIRKRLIRKGQELRAEKHLRGAELLEAEQLVQKVAQEETLLPLGPVLLPRRYESEHIFLAGKPRTGKTVCLKQQVEAALNAGGRCIIYDFKGDFAEIFYRPGQDYILNPLDDRGASWRLLGEIENDIDLDAVAEAVIPDPENEDRIFAVGAKAILVGILAYCQANGFLANSEVWEALTSSPAELKKICETTPAGAPGATYLAEPASKLAGSVIANMMMHLTWLKYADNDQREPRLTTRGFLQQPGGIVFLTGRPEVESILKPYTALFVDLLGRRVLSLPDAEHDPARKTFFFLDEFGNMQQLPTIKRLLTAGGSKGAVVLIGIQDFAAIQKIYSREEAETIFNACGTVLVLNIADPATAKYFAERFGSKEVEISAETYRMAPGDNSQNYTLARQQKEKDLILPSEIQGLSKLEGYLKIPEHSPVKIKLPIREINNVLPINHAFVARSNKPTNENQNEDEEQHE